ncbi:uncharacterized protein B0H18DRAFT_1030768, partial [Fomitopsis serialis]|uniref:uncharacterized protein n=1 Tax=Fomitopsis serialis TaxID=139415 RepID=UPI002007A78D
MYRRHVRQRALQLPDRFVMRCERCPQHATTQSRRATTYTGPPGSVAPAPWPSRKPPS